MYHPRQEVVMAKSNVRAAFEATEGNLGWGISMNPTSGGHTAQGFDLQQPLDVDYQQGGAISKADVIYFGRPFPPAGWPLILPLNPGKSSFPGPFDFGGGIGWTYGSKGGAATFSWNFGGAPQCTSGWAIVDQINSATSGMFQIACNPNGGSWLLAVNIVTVFDTQGTLTLYADGVSQGTLQDGEERSVSGKVISLGIEASFPTPSQNGYGVGYAPQAQ